MSSTIFRNKVPSESFFFSAIALTALLYGVCHIAVTATWIALPGVNEYREWAQAEAALTMWQMDGPYSGEAGTGIYLYGLFYPLLGALVHACLGGDVLPELRWLSYVLTWSVVLTGGWIVWKHVRVFWAASLAAALLLLVGWQNTVGVATPAPLGSLLLLLAIAAAQHQHPSLAALLTVSCFFVKPYFVVIAFPLLVFFILRNRRNAWLYGAVLMLGGMSAVFVVRQVYPYYFVYNVVHHLNAASSDWHHLVRQVLISGVLFLPLFCIMCTYIYKHVCRRERGEEGINADAYGVSALLLLVVWLRLGLHVGAFMSYVYHLCLPPLVVFALVNVCHLRSRYRRMVFAAGVVLLSLVVGSAWLNLPMPPGRAAVQVTLPNSSSAASLSPALARFADARGIKSYDNGQGQYVSTLYNNHPLARKLFPEEEDLRSRVQQFEPNLRRMVAERRWKTLYSDSWSMVSPDEIRQAGYHLCARQVRRVGVHDVEIYTWCKDELRARENKAL